MKKFSFQTLAGFLVVAVALSFILWMSCERATKTPVEPVVQQEGIVLNKANPMVQTVMTVQNYHTPKLMDIPGVVGVGTGLTDDGQLAIKVFTIQKGVQGIPAHLDGVPVVEKVTGKFVVYADPTARFPRPVPIGVSTGHPDITAGTIGCRVKDAAGNVYALSNNHVYANQNDAVIGDNVLQPGTYDGGQDPADAIGTLQDFEPIDFDGGNNTIDAAIAATTTSQVGFATPSGDGYGTPSSTTVSAQIDQAVQKYGRTTVWTHGTVSEINVTVDVCYEGFIYCTKLARFVNQIAITPGTFSDGGDSGSLIVTDNSAKNPVGLLFAGSSTRTLANPIDAVLSRFSVTIDDGTGGGNIPPTADFSYTTTDLEVIFTDQSDDPDGSVVAWDWNFGDGNTSSEQNPVHIYTLGGTYNVTLTVTDNEGATGETTKDVTVTSGGIILTANGSIARGRITVNLEWTGAAGSKVNIFRDGILIAKTKNDGSYTDRFKDSGGPYLYKVCETDSPVCSNEVTVTP